MDNWVEVALPEALTRKGRRIVVDGQAVFVLAAADQVFAIGADCTHQGAALDRGVIKIAGSVRTVTCPAHGSMFDLGTGKVMRPPASKPVPVYDVKVEDGLVFVRPRDGS
jgi:3-phenylpropionate/trans-cinnamate dioxygenase ferredoxin component